MPVKIHPTEEAREGFHLAQPQEYYGVKLLVVLWCVCLAENDRFCFVYCSVYICVSF